MALTRDVAFATIPELGAGLRAGRWTALELAEFFLERCRHIGPKLNAIVTVTAELALQQAAQADKDLAAGIDRGPLHGIPYGVKDLLSVPGYPTTWGAEPFRDQVLDEEADVVRKLREAGAVLIAKLAMVELAGGLGYWQANASWTGPGKNPWNVERWAGGSSSGSGAAVAAGLVPFSIGSETWGSIVTPAAYCGVTGLRPTFGRVSTTGAMTLAWTMDKLGPFARTAADCHRILSAIDAPPGSNVSRPNDDDLEVPQEGRLRLIVLEGARSEAQVHPDVLRHFESSLELLREIAEIETARLPEGPYHETANLIVSAEGAAAFEDLVRNKQITQMTAEEDRWRIYSDLSIPATDYIRAMRVREKLRNNLVTWMADFDAIVGPTMNSGAGPIDAPFFEWDFGLSSTPLGGAGNLAGLPAVSIPNGLDSEGLPTAIQIVGRPWEDRRVLSIAEFLQTRTTFHTNRPPEL